ncbi:hypothetical protein ACYULU_09275 [Breznakiellaceae bacterium SP9]
MPPIETMTFDEKLALSCKAALLHQAGDNEAAERTMKLIPMPPYLAKWAKNHLGRQFSHRIRLEFIRSGGRIWIRLAY